LVTDIEIPEVNSEIVSGYIGFLIRIDRYGVYMIGMGIGIDLSWDSSDDIVLKGHAWQP
jgi:hypothetical protein